MTFASDDSRIGLLLSGGLDSAILLGELLSAGRSVQPFYVRCDLAWEPEELAATRWLLEEWRSPKLAPLVVLEMPLADVYGDHWSMTGRQVPHAGTPDDAVYLPGRNPLLLVKTAIACSQRGIAELALASLGTNPFSDATDEFFASFEAMIVAATGQPLSVVRPLGALTKAEVMRRGQRYPLAKTFSCMSPRAGNHCGVCNKCAERQDAFAVLPGKDPTVYAFVPHANEGPG